MHNLSNTRGKTSTITIWEENWKHRFRYEGNFEDLIECYTIRNLNIDIYVVA